MTMIEFLLSAIVILLVLMLLEVLRIKRMVAAIGTVVNAQAVLFAEYAKVRIANNVMSDFLKSVLDRMPNSEESQDA